MKKINFDKEISQFCRPAVPAQSPALLPLFSPAFFTAIFKRFSLPNQLILAKKRDKKHYQIKLKTGFTNSGSILVRLLSLPVKKISRSVSGFPQIPVKSSGLSLSNYINLTGFITNYPFLKKQAKITNQSRSNQVTITAMSENHLSGLFFESNFTGNNPCLAHAAAGKNNKNQNNYNQSANNVKSLQRANNYIHDFTSLNKEILTNQQIKVNINPANIKSKLNFSTSLNTGTMIEPKNSSPRLENISAAPSTWRDLSLNKTPIDTVYHTPCN